MRYRRQRAGGARGVRDAPARRATSPRRSPCSARTPTRPRSGANARRRSGSGGCARSRTAISRRPAFPGSPSASRCGPARSAARRVGRRTATTRRVDVFLAHADEVRERSGWDAELRRAARRAHPRRRRRVRARRRRAVRARAASRPGIPGSLRASSGARACVRAARLRREVAIVGAGHGGRDRVAERARRGLRGGLDPAARAAAPSAERAAAVFSKRGLAASTAWPRRARARCCATLRQPSYPPGREWDEPLDGADARGTLPRRSSSQLNGRRAGDLRDRVPSAAAEHDPLLADLVDGARARDARPAGSCSHPTRPFPPSPTTAARSRSPASPASGRSPPPTRSRARSTPPARSSRRVCRTR